MSDCTPINAALTARVAELEDLLARMSHDESGLVEAGRESERKAILELVGRYHDRAMADARHFEGTALATMTLQCSAKAGILDTLAGEIGDRGPAVSLPPDVSAARLALYEQALEKIASHPHTVALLQDWAREALKKGRRA